MDIYLTDPEATEQFGASLTRILPDKCLVFLEGDLGAGKTSLVRGFLRGLGYQGSVKSPTYNLVESYQIGSKVIQHFDLYRLNDPEELHWLGFEDYLQQGDICFIEWPCRGDGYLPSANFLVELQVEKTGRRLRITRLG